MAPRKKVSIDGITFDLGGPTSVALDRLSAWVVWQFPRLRSGKLMGYSGAVHPSEPEQGWFPAIIDAPSGWVFIFANVPERFPTPEAAARHLDTLPD